MVLVIDEVEGATFDFNEYFSDIGSHHPHECKLQAYAEAKQSDYG